MASDESIHYGFRLNINNPEHLAIHKILRDLNPDIYQSKSKFIIDVLKKTLLDTDIDLLTGEGSKEIKKQGGYVTKEYVDKQREILKKELEAEIRQELFSMVITTLKSGGGNFNNICFSSQVNESPTEKGKKEAEQALDELTDLWS